MVPSLPALLCGHCGTCAVTTIGPGAGQHVARALNSNPGCGRFLKWLPRALIHGKEPRGMGGMTRVLIVAVIGKYGVEVRDSTHGTPCAAFTLVCTEVGQDGRLHDLYVPCEVWGKKAEATSELEPGQLVLFEGKLRKRQKPDQTWEMLVAGFELTPILAPQASLTGSTN